MIFFDTETCGLHGPAVLIQWAKDDGPVNLFSPWKSPIIETLDLIESFCNDPDGVVGFNIAFDWFHLCQLYTTLQLLGARLESFMAEPEDFIETYADLEQEARDGPCLKPVSACDLMLHARKGPYQSTMARKPIRIRRVPSCLAWQLAAELEQRVQLPDIYFARRKGKSRRAAKWQVKDIPGTNEFKNVELRFYASSALKVLCADVFKRAADARLLFNDVSLPDKLNPEEKGYAPFAKATRRNVNWTAFIKHHITHWHYDTFAREYAAADVTDTRALWKAFGSPKPGDDDSILACMVGACRWKGYNIDAKKIKALKKKAVKTSKSAPMSPAKAKAWIMEKLDPIEILGLGGNAEGKASIGTSTKKQVLEEMATGLDWFTDGVHHPAGKRALAVLSARKAKKEIELYDKLLEAGRFHASFTVIGTLSSRMAGTDGLNPQAINAKTEIRQAFTLAFPPLKLSGGDFESFEVTIAAAVYNDEKLTGALKQGKSIHGIFGTFCYDKTYEEIMATKGQDPGLYTRSKSGFFAKVYAGTAYTLTTRLGISEERAEQANAMFEQEYPGVAIARERIYEKFCSMRQPIPFGRVYWHEPADFIETMLGDRRYFTLENQICKILYHLANEPPKEWRELKVKTVRRDRVQTAGGAVQSSLFGAAFQIQAQNMRQAANHEIQAVGARITKRVQRRIWDIQPPGVNAWRVQPLNIHDEIETPVDPQYQTLLRATVENAVEEFRDKVPLIGIGWKDNLTSWAGK